MSAKEITSFPGRIGVPAELEPVVAALVRLRAAQAAESMELWLHLDLTVPQFTALHVIWRLERVSGRQLAGELGVTPASVVKVCDRLVARGYVQRVRDTSDRRVWWFQLTLRGAALFERMVAVNRERMQPALQGLSASDRESLARILNALADAVRSR
jgi:DNA-binding MarR family transcriptional regulator